MPDLENAVNQIKRDVLPQLQNAIDNVGKIINNGVILLTIWDDGGGTRPYIPNTQIDRTTGFFYNINDVKNACDSRWYNVEIINPEPYLAFNLDWAKMIKITKVIK